MVQISSETDKKWGQRIFSIEYLDTLRIQLLDRATGEIIEFNLDENGEILNETIDNWIIKFRPPIKGYARQHGLLPNVNIQIQLKDGTLLNGLIMSLVEDMIEVSLFGPNHQTIYIDFEFKGLPSFISHIEPSESPHSPNEPPPLSPHSPNEPLPLSPHSPNEPPPPSPHSPNEPPPSPHSPNEPPPPYPQSPQEIQDTETGIALVVPEDDGNYELNKVEQTLREIYIDEEDLLGDDIVIYEEIQENEKKYSMDGQTNDLMDHWIMRVPIYKRTPSFIKNIHRQIELFKYLRNHVFIINHHGFVVKKKESKNTIDIDAPWTSPQSWLIPMVHPIKKLYSNDEVTDDVPPDVELLSTDTNIREQSNLSKTESSETTVAYELYTSKIHEQFSPFIQSATTNTIVVVQDMVINDVTVTNNSGNTKKDNDVNFYRALPQMTQRVLSDDSLEMKGVVQMPSSYIPFSFVDNPSTSILDRVEWSIRKIKFYNKSHRGKTILLEDWERERPTFDKIVSSISFSHLKKLTIMQFILQLEPFWIEPETIQFDWMKIVHNKLEEQIHHIRNRTSLTREGDDGEIFKLKNEFVQLVQSDDREITSIFLSYLRDIYNIDTHSTTTGESLLHGNEIDKNILITMMIRYLLFYLVSPEKLVDTASSPIIENEVALGEKELEVDYTLSKVYHSLNEMKTDRTPYYDAIYDNTPYSIYSEKYESQKSNYLPDTFRSYLLQSLYDVEGIKEPEASEIVEAWLLGHKKVRIGDYAILIETQSPYESSASVLVDKAKRVQKKYRVFQRSAEKWIEVTTPDVIRRIIEIHDSKTKYPTVAPREKILRSFQEIAQQLSVQLKEHVRALTWKNTIEYEQKIRQQRSVIMQFTVNANANANAKPIVSSPHEQTRQWILSEPDFSIRQNYIMRFYIKFCREALTEEDPHWGYCKESNVPLFPLSIYELAVAFHNGSYAETLERLVRDIGKKSEDGDAIVDRFTNYVLKRLDNVVEDEYDDNGFKVISHSVLEQEDELDLALKSLDVKTFKSPIANKIYKVFRVLKKRLGVSDDSMELERVVMAQSMRVLCQGENCEPNTLFFMTEKEFKKEQKNLEELKKKGQPVPPEAKTYSYLRYLDRNTIAVTMSMFLVAIQTSIPSIRPRLPIPGCQYSYSGYPMNGDVSNIDGLNFLACFLIKYTTQGDDSDIWSSIMTPFTAERLTKLSLNVLRTLFENKQDLQLSTLYKKKQEYILIHEQPKSIPENLSLSRWTSFLPPLVPYSIDNTIVRDKTISVKSASMEQYKSQNIIRGYAIVEKIQKIIATDSALLLPNVYVQNACCHEDEIHPLTFFTKRDALIYADLVKIQQNDKSLSQITLQTHSPFIHILLSKNSAKPGNPERIGTQLIYATFIHYARYDYDNAIVDAEWADLCPPRPPHYKRDSTLEDKIKSIMDENIVWREEHLQQLMNRVHLKYKIQIHEKTIHDSLDKFKLLLQVNAEEEFAFIEEPIAVLLERLLPTKPIVELVSEQDIENQRNRLQREFIDAISNSIQNKYETIETFLRTYGASSSKNKDAGKALNTTLDFLKSIKNNRSILEKGDETQNHRFVKNALYEMLNCFTNQVSYYKNPIMRDISSHWKFSKSHEQRLRQLINQYYSVLHPFMNDDAQTYLQTFLNEQVPFLKTYLEWLDVLPMYREFKWRDNQWFHVLNETSMQFLLKYIWFSVLSKLTIAALDKDGHYTVTDDDNEGDEPVEICRSLAQYIQAMLSIESMNRDAMNYDYESIRNESFKAREQEKQKEFIVRIGNLNKFEQKVDKMMRQLKLGNYYVDPNFYKDPDFLEKRQKGVEPIALNEEGASATIEVDDDANRDINDYSNPLVDEEYEDENEHGETIF